MSRVRNPLKPNVHACYLYHHWWNIVLFSVASKFADFFFFFSRTPFNAQKWDVNGKEDSRVKRSLTTTAKASLFVAVVIVAMIVIVVVVIFAIPEGDADADDAAFWPSYTSDSKLGVFDVAAVSTDAAPCAPIGKDILERNGTAMDAAIAVLACMGAHNPHSMGLGGGFLMLYYNRTEQRAYFMDAREVAPRNSKVDMFEGNASMSLDGGLAIAVPGELAGYADAHRQFGKLPWKDLFAPTIKMCKSGVEVSAHLARAIRNNRELLMEYDAISKVFLKNGTDIYKEGEHIKMPDLARTLEVIANQGMEALYGPSELANQFLQDLKDAGSIIDHLDIQDYSPQMREPVKVSLRNGTTLYSVSNPGGGPLLGFMMSVLDGYPDMNECVSKNKTSAVLAYHRIIETFKYAYAYRNQLEDDDSEDIENLLKKMASPEYAAFIRSRINDSRTFGVSHYGTNFSFVEDHGTAHLSLVAPNGDAVAVTSTINTYFGSKILSPSTGIVLNNEMDDFSSPNITNYFDLPPSTKNRIRPGKRPMSSMSPAILVDSKGDVKLVVGGNGGTMITTGVLQVAARVLFFGESVKQAIDAPRIHHQLTPNVMHYEKGFPEALRDKLSELGHKVRPWTMGMMSIIMGIARGDDGYLYANSDYRKGGDVQGF